MGVLADPWSGAIHSLYLEKAAQFIKDVLKLNGFDRLRITPAALIELVKVLPTLGLRESKMNEQD